MFESFNAKSSTRLCVAKQLIMNAFPQARHVALAERSIDNETGLFHFALAQRAITDLTLGGLSRIAFIPVDDVMTEGSFIKTKIGPLEPPNNHLSLCFFGFNPYHKYVDPFLSKCFWEERSRINSSIGVIEELKIALIKAGKLLTTVPTLATVGQWRDLNALQPIKM